MSRPEDAVPLSRSELKKLAKERLKDAKILLDAGNYSGSYYLCGYAVECGLKAIIAKNIKGNLFPDKDFAAKCWTHKLDKLAELANLNIPLENKLSADQDFAVSWSLTKDKWSERSRYKRYSKRDAKELYFAVSDNDHGVLSWLTNYW